MVVNAFVEPHTARRDGRNRCCCCSAAVCRCWVRCCAPVLPRMQAQFADVPGGTVLVPVVLTLPALMIALLRRHSPG